MKNVSLKRLLAFGIAFMMMFSSMTNMSMAATKKKSSAPSVYPVVQGLKTSYKVNEIITLSMNTKGVTSKQKIQYKVSLLNLTTKKPFDVSKGYTTKYYATNYPYTVRLQFKYEGSYNLIVTSKIVGTKTVVTKTYKFDIKAPDSGITSIEPIDVNVKVGDKYSLPSVVSAKMKDGSSKNFNITWTNTNVDTSKAGTYTYKGRVTGYNNDVVLTLNVTDITWAETTNAAVMEGESYNLPKTVKVKYSDGSYQDAEVKWDSTIDTSKPGTYTYKGKVNNYSEDVVLNLTVKPVELSIKNIDTSNLKEIKVYFSKGIDLKTVTKEHFRLYKNNGIAVTSASYLDDGKTVVITSSTSFEKGGNYTLVIDGVKDLTGKVFERTTKTIDISDNKAPVPVKVVPLNSVTLGIEFSEPVKETGSESIEVKSGSTQIKTSSMLDGLGTNYITVFLNSPLTVGGKYDVAIKGFKDFAGYEGAYNLTQFIYAEDTTLPKANIEVIDPGYAVVKFTKPVTGLVKEEFYHTVDTYIPIGIYSNSEMTTPVSSIDYVDRVWVKFYDAATGTGHPILDTTDSITVLKTYKTNEIVDTWGNEFEGAVLKVSLSLDKTKPEVVSINQEMESQISVRFNKDVKFALSNIEISNSKGSKLSGYSISGSGSSYIINLPDGYIGETLTVKIKDVCDNQTIPNKMDTYTTSITMTDKTPPQVVSITKRYVEGLEKAIYVTFTRPLGESALTPENYALQNPTTSIMTRLTEKPSYYNGNTIVRIPLTDEQASYVDKGYNLFVSNVADSNGNVLQGQIVPGAKIINYDLTKPSVVKLEARDNKTIDITFNQPLTRADISAFTLNGAQPDAIKLSDGSNGNTIVTLTCAAGKEFAQDLSNASLAIATGNGKRIENMFGVNVDSVVFSNSTSIKIEDKMPPAIKTVGGKLQIGKIVNSSGKVEAVYIEYNKEVDTTKLSALSYSLTGGDIAKVYTNKSAAKVDVPVRGSFVIIEIKSGTAASKLSISQVLDIYDMSGNKKAPDGMVYSLD